MVRTLELISDKLMLSHLKHNIYFRLHKNRHIIFYYSNVVIIIGDLI